MLLLIIRVVVGVAVLAGFLWLVTRLLSRMIDSTTQSPPGFEPTDRVEGDKDTEIM